MARDEFSPSVKKQLALRAGYLCSICNALTVGPSEESDTAANITGVAAHITAASPGGRRYDSKLTPEQRASYDNGIWVCSDHGKLIDGDEVTFTTPYLKTAKRIHEQKIKLEHKGVRVEKGVITKIELSNFGLITAPITLEFTDRNIIKGDNGVGKTLILEMMASLTNKKHLNRWLHDRGKKNNSFCNIYYFKDQPDKFSIFIDKQHKVSYSFNDNPSPLLAPPMKIFYLRESYGDFLQSLSEEEEENTSLVSLMSKYFEISEDEFINVVGAITRERKYFCHDISLNETNDDLEIQFYSKPNSPIVSFGALSGGERQSVILEITLKIANYYAKFNSTILLIENSSFGTIDFVGINHLLDIIRMDKPKFQFFFTTIGNPHYKIEEFMLNELEEKNKEVFLKEN